MRAPPRNLTVFDGLQSVTQALVAQGGQAGPGVGYGQIEEAEMNAETTVYAHKAVYALRSIQLGPDGLPNNPDQRLAASGLPGVPVREWVARQDCS